MDPARYRADLIAIKDIRPRQRHVETGRKLKGESCFRRKTP
jgi:hypothetical protein